MDRSVVVERARGALPRGGDRLTGLGADDRTCAGYNESAYRLSAQQKSERMSTEVSTTATRGVISGENEVVSTGRTNSPILQTLGTSSEPKHNERLCLLFPAILANMQRSSFLALIVLVLCCRNTHNNTFRYKMPGTHK